jgi:hypothetical protein
MDRRFRIPLRANREGQTLAIVAVSMVALLALLSLGIDLGMAYTARAEAQRVADSAALAGASVFWEAEPPLDPVAAAEARAREYAAKNVVRNRPVDPDEDVMVWVLLNDQRVRVRIERRGLPTWFARFIGRDHLTVSAIAAASVMDAGAAKCLMPWAVIDLFSVDTWPTVVRPEQPMPYDPNQQHWYAPKLTGSEPSTGFGALPEEDWGRELVIKSQRPTEPYVPEPGVFLPLRMANSEGQEACSTGGGGGGSQDPGAAVYRRNICSCNETNVEIGQQIPIQTGNMVGPTRQGVNELIGKDPDATWTGDPDHPVEGGLGMASPRIVSMIMIGPDEIDSSGMQRVTVVNLGRFFIEGFDSDANEARVVGRFFWTLDGQEGSSNATSPMVRILRLVE